jgi:hypothetical protein
MAAACRDLNDQARSIQFRHSRRHVRYGPLSPETARLDNRLTLGASADYKLLCEPSQSGALPVCLHWQKYTVFVSSAVQAIGVKDVPLCAPLQNG